MKSVRPISYSGWLHRAFTTTVAADPVNVPLRALAIGLSTPDARTSYPTTPAGATEHAKERAK